MADIELSETVRPNPLRLTSGSASLTTRERHAAGAETNSAYGNPTGLFTAAALDSRARDLAGVLDAMANDIRTIEAADHRLKAIIATVDAMQSALRDRSANDMSIGLDGGDDVRAALVDRFNRLRDEVNTLADDASVNGTNLLRGDTLRLTFDATSASTIDIGARDADGKPISISTDTLSIDALSASDLRGNGGLDARMRALQGALDLLRAQSATFGSHLSMARDRADFTRHMIATLESGAANLPLADASHEAANLLALQTRQQFSSCALSLAAQAEHAVLRLF